MSKEKMKLALEALQEVYWSSRSAKHDEAITALREALAEQPAPVQGWKLVPVEPTEDMWKAVNKLDDEMAAGSYDGKGCSIEQAWDCLLAAAPQPAQQEPWEHLKAYGYAPGGYMMTCRGCNSTVTGVDKRASRCMPCATKAAEQPAQQEPVARQYQNRDGVWKDFISEKHYKDTLEDGSWPIRNLYTSPPAQRTWVGLTDEEVRKVNQEVWGYVSADHARMRGYAQAIEAKLRSKNNG